MSWQILTGDCREVLASLPAASVHTCVTSPPYFGLRDYGHDGQIGLEPTPDEFVQALVGVFREVRRVLRDDGTVWLNLGDSYAAHGSGAAGKELAYMDEAVKRQARQAPVGCKPKDLLGIPWMVAFALRADGWYLRSEVIWHKPNPMPESVTDRPTRAHEQVFLLSKQARYYYDAVAIAEPTLKRVGFEGSAKGYAPDDRNDGGRSDYGSRQQGTANKRSVWSVPSAPYAGAHFATFPPKLIEPCILAGCPEGGTVLDPFAGAGTTGMVALRHGRSFVGVELNEEYARLARDRIVADAPLMNSVSEVAA